MRQFIISIIACCFVHTGFAQKLETSKLDSYLQTLDQNDQFMGSVSVSRNNATIYSKAVGFSNIESKTKATENSTYRIGSISKTFTAVMIFQVIEKGRLTLSTTLDHYFPTIKNAKTITIDHLLSHRSGIHNFTDNNFKNWATEPKSRDELLKIISEGGSDFAPGSQQQYSNSNYVLLSYILEIIHKQSFAEILQKCVAKPLHLTNTYFGKQHLGESKSYKYFDKWRIEDNTDPSVTMGAGGIVSTPNDLNTFFYALFNNKLITSSSRSLMTPTNGGIGKGLIQFPFGSRIGYGHTGGIDGFNSIAIYFPDDRTAYSLISNASNFVINNISIAVLSFAYGIPFDVPSFNAINLSSNDLDKYLGVYSTSQLPMKITITKRGNVLVGQGTGQAPFDFKATAEHTFAFNEGGIVVVFDPTKGSMTLKQGGGTFFMKKE